MASSLVKSIKHTNSLNPSPWKPSPSFHTVRQQLQKENPNLSDLIQEFYLQMQSRVDPSLESIWVYAALTFRSRNHPKDDIFDQIAAAKSLFQLISSCSAACGGAKSVALLAPVVALAFDVVLEYESSRKEMGLKKERKVMKELRNLVGVIVGFINVCCSNSNSDSDSDSGWSFLGLGCVWCDRYVNVGDLFPLVSSEVRDKLSERDGDVNYFAGVVMAEMFQLRLFLNFRDDDTPNKEMEAELRTWAIGSLTGFQNVYAFEVLSRMMLDKDFVSSVFVEDQLLMRSVLYDALILVEYSFLNPEKAIHISAEYMKIIAMRRLVLAHEAVEFFREQGDQRRCISYTTAFSSSLLYSQIVKWVKSQIPVEDSSVKSKGTSPKAVIEWLLNLERQGFLVFGDSILKHHSVDISKPPASKLDSNEMDEEHIFYIDNQRQGEHTDDGKVNEYISAAFLAAANTMTSVEKRGKKRKGENSESEAESEEEEEEEEEETGKKWKGENSESEEETSLSDDDSNTI